MQQGGGEVVSILLSGAELADFRELSNLQLFWNAPNSSEEQVELRSKSGISVDSAVPFSFGWASRVDEEYFGFDDDSRDYSGPAGFNSEAGSSKLPLFVDSEGSSAAVSPIILKSRAVVQAEKKRESVKDSAQEEVKKTKMKKTNKKQRAISMDESSFQEQRSISSRSNSMRGSRDDLFGSRKKSVPLPLPLPPPPESSSSSGYGNYEDEDLSWSLESLPTSSSSAPDFSIRHANPSRNHHRRHLSIDLRASPAAKFLVQVMPWELPSASPSPSAPLDEFTSSSIFLAGRRSSSVNCFVPFKWEETPGKPKNFLSLSSSNNNNNGSSLRLPPRLQQHASQQNQKASSLSPTSTLDRHGVESTTSSSSSPNNAAASTPCEADSTSRGKIPGKIRAILTFWVVWAKQSKTSPSSRDVESGSKKDDDLGLLPKKKKMTVRSSSSSRKKKSRVNTNIYSNPFEDGSDSNYYRHFYNTSWSPSPMAWSWFHRSPPWMRQRKANLKKRQQLQQNWALGKIASGCNVVRRAVRFRWWSRRRGSGSNRRSMYKPLLCRVDAESAGFACSTR